MNEKSKSMWIPKYIESKNFFKRIFCLPEIKWYYVAEIDN